MAKSSTKSGTKIVSTHPDPGGNWPAKTNDGNKSGKGRGVAKVKGQ